MKYLFSERVEKGYPDEPLLTASQSHGVIAKSDYGTRTVEAQKDLHLLKLVEPGDYVISLRSFQGGIEVSHARGIISPAYTVLSPRSFVLRSYYEHYFKSTPFVQCMPLFVTGIREGQNIDYVRLSRAYLPVPPAEEQEAIGRFIRHLDHRVNRLVKAKRRLIELLNEQKQGIAEYVLRLACSSALATDQADGNARSKHRPAIRELRRIVRFVSGGTPPKANLEYWQGPIPWVSPKDMKYSRITDSIDHISEDGRSRASLSLLVPGSLLIVVRGMILARTVPLAITAGPVTINQDIKGLLVDREVATPEYLYLALKGSEQTIRSMVDVSGHGTRRLATPQLARLRLPVPSRDAQRRLVDEFELRTSTLDCAISNADREIALIREYRTRLVADVVTGQLEVRHLDLPDVDIAEPEDEVEPEEDMEVETEPEEEP